MVNVSYYIDMNRMNHESKCIRLKGFLGSPTIIVLMTGYFDSVCFGYMNRQLLLQCLPLKVSQRSQNHHVYRIRTVLAYSFRMRNRDKKHKTITIIARCRLCQRRD